MELVWIAALILGAWGMLCVPLVYWARKPIATKFWYWKNKGSGGKIVDYFTSDGDHDVYCTVPDANGAFKLPNGKMHHISRDTTRYSRFYDGRMIVCQDTSMGSIDPILKTVQKVPPELIDGALSAVRIAEQKNSRLAMVMRNKEWMQPAILIGVGLCIVICYMILNGQADLVGMCQTGQAIIIPPAYSNVTVLP